MREDEPRITVDVRESVHVKKALTDLGLQVVEAAITPADYVLSGDYAVERKSFNDFLRSVFDGRLFDQVDRLAEAYKNPILLMEGDLQGLIEVQNPLVFWGALAKVLAVWGVSVVFTPNQKHTAMFLNSLATKLRAGGKRPVVAKHKPRIYTLRQKQLLAVQSLPNIGPGRAEKLLKRFGSLRRVFSATKEELLSVEGLGKKTVQGIRELLDTKYPGLEQT